MLTTEPDRYLELLINYPPRPIQTQEQCTEVQAQIDRILDSENISSAQQEYLNLLGTLVREYEEKHISIPDLSGVELLKVLMDELEIQAKDLTNIFKTESILTDILDGNRPLTIEHIEQLADRFKLSPSIFLSSIKNQHPKS
jgi:HTH-type transcriptional regulator / antitoxin HigA